MSTDSDRPSGLDPHDHEACVDRVLRMASEGDARFTPVRRRALEILLERHEAMGAYDLLARLREEGFGAQPPVAYRALEFLVAHGYAHRIERLNAFVACMHPGEQHAPAFLICRGCRAVAETEGAHAADLETAASAAGFAVERTVLEVEGLCATCKAAE